MNLTDQVAEMLLASREKLNPPEGASHQFEQLVAAGLVRRREYDIAPVNVFGSSGGAPAPSPLMNQAGREAPVRSAIKPFR